MTGQIWSPWAEAERSVAGDEFRRGGGEASQAEQVSALVGRVGGQAPLGAAARVLVVWNRSHTRSPRRVGLNGGLHERED